MISETAIKLKLFLLFLSVIVNTAIGIFVYIRHPKKIVHRAFLLFALSLALWGVSNMLVYSQRLPYKIEIFGKFAFAASALVPFTFLYFSLSFPESPQVSNKKILPLFLITCAFIFISYTPLLQKGVTLSRKGYIPIFGPLAPLFFLYVVSYVLAGLVNWGIKYKSASSRVHQKQIQFGFLGFLLYAILAFFFNVTLPILGVSHLFFMGPLLTVIMMSFIAYSIVRYRLFDITFFLKRTALYIILTGLLTGAFLIAVILTERLTREIAGYQSIAPAIVISFFIAFAYLPLREKIQHFLDVVFFPSKYNYQKILRKIASEINRSMRLVEIVKKLVDEISQVLEVDTGSLWLKKYRDYKCIYSTLKELNGQRIPSNHALIRYLKKRKDALIKEEIEKRGHYSQKFFEEYFKLFNKLKADIAIPIFREGELDGVLFLSNKKSGDIFTQEDVNLLLTIGSQAGIALQNALLYEEAQSARIFQESILTHMENGVLGIEKEGIVRIYNQKAYEFLKIPPSQIIGKDFRDVMDGEIRWVIDQVFLRKERISRWEVKLPEKGGEYILGVTGIPLRDQNRHFSGALIVMIDLTELRRLESELHHSERLAAIGKLAATLAHEIKNPLASIKTFVQIVKSGEADEEVRSNFAEVVFNEVERVDNLLQELLDLSKPEVLHKKECNMNKIVEETLYSLLQEAKKREIELEQVLDKNVPTFPVDPQRMKQVILNLVINAMEAMDKRGKITVYSGFEKVDGRMGKYLLKVKDTGKGIAEEEIPKIFEIFYTTKKGGSGLGLALVKKIVEAHGGSIKVKSELGKGSEFMVILPVKIRESEKVGEEKWIP